MQKSIEALQNEFTQDIQKVKTSSDLEETKVKFLGKKGPIQNLMKT